MAERLPGHGEAIAWTWRSDCLDMAKRLPGHGEAIAWTWRSDCLDMAENFLHNPGKRANLSVLMAKVMSMEIMVDES
jgi:hypothetical protein